MKLQLVDIQLIFNWGETASFALKVKKPTTTTNCHYPESSFDPVTRNQNANRPKLPKCHTTLKIDMLSRKTNHQEAIHFFLFLFSFILFCSIFISHKLSSWQASSQIKLNQGELVGNLAYLKRHQKPVKQRRSRKDNTYSVSPFCDCLDNRPTYPMCFNLCQ